MEEINAWNYMQMAGTTSATYFIGMAFLTWVGFRISSSVYNADSSNMIVKVAGTVFCVTVAWFWLFLWAIAEWNMNGVAGAFAFMQSQGMEISSGAQYIIANSDPAADPSIMPNIPQGLFLLSVLAIQLGGLWMKKD